MGRYRGHRNLGKWPSRRRATLERVVYRVSEGGLQGKYRVGVYRVATREKVLQGSCLQGKYRVAQVRHVMAK